MTEHQTREFIKCRKEPIYFLREYGTVRHPTKGLLKFDLWDFQEECVTHFLKNSYNIVLKARQLGLSTLCAGYAAWLMTFFDNKEIYILATKGTVATNLVSKVKVLFDNLPDWLKPYKNKPTIDNRQSVELSNGSKIHASTTTREAGRSESLSLLIVDEAAFINDMDEIWIAAQPTLSTGGDCVVLSTPNGIGNWFHKLYTEAEQGSKMLVGGRSISFNPIKLHWSMHPEREEKWAASMRKSIGLRAFAQEHDADFLQSGSNVIDMNDIFWYKENPTISEGFDESECPHEREPIEKSGFDKNLWIWKYPDYSRQYLISADVARGDGSDYSTFHVIDVEAYEQVAEYKGKIPTDVFGHMLVQVAVQYNNALLVPENNNVGWATIQKILDLNYGNLYWTDKARNFIDINKTQDIHDPYDTTKKNMIPGFSTTSRTRPVMIARMEEEIRSHDLILHSTRLLTEFHTFVFKENGKPEHMDGYNDDLILALAIGVFIRGTMLRMYQAGNEIQKGLIDNMSFSHHPYEFGIIKPKAEKAIPKELTLKVGDSNEDLLWLIRG